MFVKVALSPVTMMEQCPLPAISERTSSLGNVMSCVQFAENNGFPVCILNLKKLCNDKLLFMDQSVTIRLIGIFE